MTYRIVCPQCAHTFNAQDGRGVKLEGCVVLCPNQECGHMFTVRVARDPEPPANAWLIK